MTYTLVHANTLASNTGTSPVTATCTATTAGNLLACCVACDSPGTLTITMPAGWVAATPASSAGSPAATQQIWCYPNCPAGITSVAVTLSASGTSYTAQIFEFHDSAGASTSPVDVTGVLTKTTSPVGIATSAAAAAGDLAVSCLNGLYSSAATNTLSAGAGFTQGGVFKNGTSAVQHVSNDYQLSVSAGVVTDSVSFTGGTLSNGIGVIATFKPYVVTGPGSVVQAAAPVHLTSLTGPVNVTLPNPTGTGNTLVACAGSNGSATANPHITGITLGGAAGNWAAGPVLTSTTTLDAEIWYDPGCAAGQTAVAVTFGGGGGTGDLYVSVYEVQGVLTLDKSHTGEVGPGTAWSSGATATTAQANEVFFGIVMNAGGQAATVTGVGTWVTQALDVSGFTITSGYQNVTATGTATYSGTVGTSANCTAVVATFYVAAGASLLPQQVRHRAPATFTRINAPSHSTVYSR